MVLRPNIDFQVPSIQSTIVVLLWNNKGYTIATQKYPLIKSNSHICRATGQ